jgi:hypothetical protein
LSEETRKRVNAPIADSVAPLRPANDATSA